MTCWYPLHIFHSEGSVLKIKRLYFIVHFTASLPENKSMWAGASANLPTGLLFKDNVTEMSLTYISFTYYGIQLNVFIYLDKLWKDYHDQAKCLLRCFYIATLLCVYVLRRFKTYSYGISCVYCSISYSHRAVLDIQNLPSRMTIFVPFHWHLPISPTPPPSPWKPQFYSVFLRALLFRFHIEVKSAVGIFLCLARFT